MIKSLCSARWAAYVMLLLAGVMVEPLCGAESSAAGVDRRVRIVPVGPGYALSHINATSFNRSNILSAGQWQFIAYYNDQQKATIARRRLEETTWRVFPTSFVANNIKDAHDVISMAVDGQGRMHMSWGMHGDAFHYARSLSPVTSDDPIAFGPDGKMTGQENQVTYPEFYRLADGGLLYMFREGSSGNGDTYLSRFDPTVGTWAPVHTTGGSHSPFIKGSGRTPNSNAYPNNLILDRQGRLHLVWTWRYNSDSPAKKQGYQTNHDYSYARSADGGRTWTRMDGTPYVLPLTEPHEISKPASVAETALSIPEGSSLINTTSLAVDREDRPVIATWWAPGVRQGNHIRQYMLVWHDGSRWRTSQITRRGVDYDPNGDGQSDPIPETRLGAFCMARPIVVVDRNNRIIVVFNDYQHGQNVTAAWSDDRVNWRLVTLSEEKMGRWEPTYDAELWQRQNKLHMLYQPLMLGPESSAVSVLELDPKRIPQMATAQPAANRPADLH